jgi:hypothetical protein
MDDPRSSGSVDAQGGSATDDADPASTGKFIAAGAWNMFPVELLPRVISGIGEGRTDRIVGAYLHNDDLLRPAA